MDIGKIPDLDEVSENIKPIFEIAQKFKPSTFVIPSSLDSFDKVMDGGFRGGELVVMSGQTGQGKTMLGQILTANFDKIGIPSLWFSYECNPWYLKEKFEQMGCTKDLLAYSPVELVANTLEFIDNRIDEAIRHYGCKVVFIDHLHYLIPLDQSVNSSLLIGGIVRELKKMAVKKDITIFLIAHTKKIYQDERLDLSSIRDSSLISQEADYVFLIERIKKSDKIMESSGSEWTNQTKVAIAKNRRTGKLVYYTFEVVDNQLKLLEDDIPTIGSAHRQHELIGERYDQPFEVPD